MRPAEIAFAGQHLVLDPAGVLFWPAERMLVVADLHFEKGSAFARRGCLLPPHDTLVTIERLEQTLARLRPDTVVSLGDGFHDRRGPSHLAAGLAARITAMTAAHRWLWVSGNHDPEPPHGLGGVGVPEVSIGELTLRHAAGATRGSEIAGHLHPRAKLRLGARIARLGCFVTDGRRLVLPAFGAFTGGLNVLDGAIASLFDGGFATYVLGSASCRRVPHDLLVHDTRSARLASPGANG